MIRVALDMLRAQREGPAGLARRRGLRLAALVAHARSRSAYYRRRYAGLPGEGLRLRDLPPVTKPELMASFDDWVTDPAVTRAGVERFVADPTLVGKPYLGAYFVCTSSGTTGRPGLFVHDPGAIAVYRAMTIRIDLAWLGAADLLPLLRRAARWATVVATGGHFAAAAWIEAERRRGLARSRRYRVVSLLRPIDEIVAELNAFDPAILTSYPSALDLLGGEQAAERLRVRPVIIESGGETLLDEVRARIAQAFGRDVHEVYGSSEFDPTSFDCRERWLHVASDWAVLEPVDADGSPTSPGQPSHTVLLTNLANHVQPLIRYDLGDSILERPDPCPCGSPLPAIRVVGRCDDVLRLSTADGRPVAILPLSIGSVLETTPGLHRAQLLLASPTELRVRMEAEPGRDPDAVWSEIATRLRAFLAAQGVTSVVLVRAPEPPVQSPRSGKFRQVIAGGGDQLAPASPVSSK